MDAANFEQYISVRGLNYVAMPADCYSFNMEDLDYSSAEPYKIINLQLNTSEIDRFEQTLEEGQTCVLPIMLTSTSDSILADKNTLILPAMFHFKNSSVSTELEAELKKHKFMLSYDAEKVAEGGETLDLYVNHIITEDIDETRTSYTVSYQAYDLSSVLHQFTNLKKIIVHAQVNTSSNKLDNSSTREEKFEIDYSKISQ